MAGVFDDVRPTRRGALDGIAPRDPITPEERAAAEQLAAGRQGEFSKGLRRAATNASATSRAALGQAAESFAPDFAARQFDKANAIQRNTPTNLKAEVQSFRDVNNLDSAASFGAGALGEGITSVATIVAGGLAARFGLGSALRLGAAGKNAAQFAGGAATMLPQEAGETALTLRNNPEAMANTTPLERTGLSFGKGAVASAMESIVPQAVFAKTIGGAANRIASGAAPALGNVARKGAAGAVGEFATEGAQELSGQVAENLATGETGYDFERALEAAVKGAITGGVLGGAGGTVQAARSNIDAAAETAAETARERGPDVLNAAVEKLDNLIRNPEAAGIDMTEATLGTLAEAAGRAREVGDTMADAAGPAVASGMDAIAGLKGQLDNAVAGKLEPENVKKYVELTKNIRLLSPTEYEILRDATASGDVDAINRAVGIVGKKLQERVPRETMDNLRSLVDWGKRFGRGVTRAAREGRKASQSYAKEDIVRFRTFLNDQYPKVLRTMDESGASDQLARVMMTYRDDAQLLNAKLRPKDQEAIDSFEKQTGVPLQDVLFGARNWRNDNITSREKKDAYAASTGASQTGRITNDMQSLLTDELRDQYEADGISIGPGATESEEGIIRGDDGELMGVEDTRKTPFNSLGMVKRVIGTDTFNGNPPRNGKNPGFTLPSKLRSKDLTAAQIGRLLGGKDSANSTGKWEQSSVDLTDEQIAERTNEDGSYNQDFNSIDIAAQAGTPQASGGSRENFEGFVPEFDGSNRDLNIQGHRLLSAIASIHGNGIDIPRSEIDPALLEEWGMDPDGDDIHIDVEMDPNMLGNNTVVQVGKKKTTIGDLNGTTRSAKSLGSQLALLDTLGDNPNGELKTLQEGAGEKTPLTAKALSGGMYNFALRQEKAAGRDLTAMRAVEKRETVNSYAAAYRANLIERMDDSAKAQTNRRNISRLNNGVREGIFTPEDVNEYIEVFLRAYTPAERDAYEYELEQLDAATTLEEQENVETADVDPDQLATEDEALAWADGLELEYTDTDDLVDLLIEFKNKGMLDYENSQEAFNSEPGLEEPTVAQKVNDAFEARRKEGAVTNASTHRITEKEVAPPPPSTQAQVDQAQKADVDETVRETKAQKTIRKRSEKLAKNSVVKDKPAGETEGQARIRKAKEAAGVKPAAKKVEPQQKPDPLSASERIKAAQTEADLDAIQSELLSNQNLDIEEADHINQMHELQLDRIKTEGADRFIQSLKDGSGTLSSRTIRQRAVNNWAKKYLPPGHAAKVVDLDVTNDDQRYFLESHRGELSESLLGFAAPGSTLNFTGDGTSYIFLTPKGKKPEKLGHMSILAHEFGHLIQFEAHYADKENWKAINDLYQQDIGKDFTNSMSVTRLFAGREDLVDQVEAGTMTPEEAMAEARQYKQDQLGKKVADALYQTSFAEWFAENFAKYAINDSGVFAQADAGVKKQLNDIIAKLKQFYNEVVKKNFTPDQSFSGYLESLAARQKELAENPERQNNINERVGLERARTVAREIDAHNKIAKKEEAVDDRNPPPPEDTTSEPPTETGGVTTPPTDTGEVVSEPPQEPPKEPPGGESPPPPPDNDARAKFIATVKRLLGNRVNVTFDAKGLPEGVAAIYESAQGMPLEDTKVALKEIREKRATALAEAKRIEALLKDPTNKIPAEEMADPEALREEVQALEAEEQRYLNDAAVRGTIRVAAGMEAQAGLAEHEAFHGAFEIFFGQDNAADRKVVTTAFTRGVLSKRLQKYFAGNEEVLAVIDPTSKDFNAEEAAAYAFQVFLHEPGALQMGQKVEGIFNKFLAYLQKLVGYKTYEQKARMVFNDLNSGQRAERRLSVLRDSPSVEKSMLTRSQDFVRGVGTGFMHMYDTVLSSSYDRLEGSGNVAMAQIARLGYNETGQEGQGMIQSQRHQTTKWSNHLKEALHTLNTEELSQLNTAMMLNEDLTGKLKKPQERLRAILDEIHQYQVDAGVELGFKKDYFPMIWNPEKVSADPEGFLAMLNKPEYAEAMRESMRTADDIFEAVASFEERGHEFQGIFNKDGEPVADSSRRRSLSFIENADRVAYMEDDLITTMGHYLNQSVRHAEYVRSYGQNGAQMKKLMGEITSTYGGTQADVDLAKDYIDGLMGNKEVGMSRELKDLYGAATVYQNVRLLPLSVFSSLVDPLGVAVRTNSMGSAFDTFTYSIRNMFTDFRNENEWSPDQWTQYAADIGTIDMSGTVKSIDKIYTGVTLRGKTQEINDAFFKWNLLNGWVKNNHIMATKAAQLFLRRSAEGEMFGAERSAENLQEVGVEAGDIVYDEGLGRIRSTAPEILGYESAEQMELQASEDEIQGAREQADRIQQAIHKIVRQSMIQPSSAEMPGWMSNPYLAPIAHLKTFVFGFNATILQRLLHEAKRGNYNPIYYAAAYVPGMIAADFVKGFAGNGGEEPEWKKNWGVSDYLEYGVERSGLLGTGQFFSDMNNDVTRGGAGFESLAGPSIEQATDLMGAMNAKTSRPTATWMVNALPANALYDQWVN